MSAHLLLKYGKIRNESKGIAIFDGSLRYQHNAEYIYACKSWGCQGRNCSDSGWVITILNWKQQGVKSKNIHLNFTPFADVLCENKPGYARKQKTYKRLTKPEITRKTKEMRGYATMIKVLFICHGSRQTYLKKPLIL